jgi:photosystem II stability/assembly factor-like uncharacterized protein
MQARLFIIIKEKKMKLKKNLFAVLVNILLLISSTNAQWVDTGCPFGGYTQAITTAEPQIFIGTNQGGVYRSTDNGASWLQVNTGLTNTDVTALKFSGSTLFAGTATGGVFRSSDYGSNWVEVNNGLAVLFINALAVSGSNIYAGASYSVTGGGVFHSTNNGNDWAYIGLTDHEVYSLAVSGSNLFAGTDGGVFVTTNNGGNWSAVNSGLTEDDIYALTVSNNNLYAGTSAGVFFSSDNGANWTDISSATLADKTVQSIAIHQVNIIAGTGGYGVYVSTNNGATWEESDEGLPNSFADIRALSMSSTTLYAGTLFIGAWERPLTDYLTDVISTSDDLPQNFYLSQNYPNPFNPSTSIEFSIPQASFVELKVFDVLGNEVVTLAKKNYPAGTYKTDFNADDLPSGMYIARMTAKNFIQTKKMLLLK